MPIILLKKFTKLSPNLYEPRNDIIQVNSDKNSWENPLIKEKKADKTTKNNLDLKYINSLFPDENDDPVLRFYKVLEGYNQNEVNLVPNNIKKTGFFEKFFQLFS